jgi:translation initiation factor 3 subunit D
LLHPGSADFRQKLDSQGSAVLSDEIKNDGFKLSRWCAQAVLAGADELKLGFLTRSSARDPRAGHSILSVQRFRPAEFAAQLSCDVGKMFATLRRVSEAVLEQEDGQYLLLRDANEPKLTLYRLPEGYDFHDEKVVMDEDEDDE